MVSTQVFAESLH